MSAPLSSARRVDPRKIEVIDVMGATIQFLVEPEEAANEPCVMRGTIPAGGLVPMHAHPEPETFIHLSGEIEALTVSNGKSEWVAIGPGDVLHVPGGAKHGFRNRSSEPAVEIVVSTYSIGRFFREIGVPFAPGREPPPPPSAERIEHFLEVSKRYGYWNASPEENAEVGLLLPLPG